MQTPALTDSVLLQQAMLFYQLEQRHHLLAHGSRTHVRMLLILHRRGSMAQSDLARLMALEKSWVSRAVDKLVEAGWVERTPDGSDRRSVRLLLTPPGQDEAMKIERVMDGHAQSVLARLGEADRPRVVEALRLLHAVLEPPGKVRKEGGPRA